VNDDKPDPVTVLRIHRADWPPGFARFYLCPRSLAHRLVVNAVTGPDDVRDLGPGALLFTQAAKPAEFHRNEHRYMVHVGDALGGRWLVWTPPAPVEPVPGSPGARAAQQ
jgi:hypothetical protein